jgi:uncharacterized protein YcbK (DUF882 family)
MAGLPRAVRSVGFAVCALLVGSQGLQNAIAEGDTRTITFHHLHTGENLTITYKRDGRFDDDALKKINHEMRDWRRDEEVRIDPRVIDTIWEVNREVGGREPIQIVCGYRAPATNQMLRRRSRGVAQFSQHTLGKAVDFYIPGVPLEQLRAAGLRLQRGGVGFYPTSGSPFVHLDVGSVRHWPRMTHDQLARVFPNGRTVHVPSDGRPLAGYAVALADLQKRGSIPSPTSTEAARNAGIAVAETPKRSLLASLFSSGTDEDEDSETASTPAPATVAPAAPRAHAAVPLPIARPTLREAAAMPARDSSFTLASADSTPVQLDATQPEPAAADNVFAARGMWEGPQGRPQPPAAIPESAPVQVASAGPELGSARMRVERRPTDLDTTGGVTRWPTSGTDRVPADVALAYAAQNDGPIAMPVTRAAPMGASAARKAPPATNIESDGLTTLVKKMIPRQAVAARPANPLPSTAALTVAPVAVGLAKSAIGPGATYEDPWLRAMVLAPDLQNYLTVTAFEPPDPRQLRAMMQKPEAAVMMTFSNDPHLGMTSERFSGTAVVFVSTVSFPSRTAMLR